MWQSTPRRYVVSDKVVHFEIPADDVDRARAFYKDAFGWTINAIPELRYNIVETTPIDNETNMPTEPGAINGGMMQREAPVTGPVITIGVDDVDSALRRVEELGGKAEGPKLPVGDMGFAAYFSDPEGNILGLWESAQPS
jgi:predicted enzyme related to lactoylglutathione lyase